MQCSFWFPSDWCHLFKGDKERKGYKPARRIFFNGKKMPQSPQLPQDKTRNWSSSSSCRFLQNTTPNKTGKIPVFFTQATWKHARAPSCRSMPQRNNWVHSHEKNQFTSLKSNEYQINNEDSLVQESASKETKRASSNKILPRVFSMLYASSSNKGTPKWELCFQLQLTRTSSQIWRICRLS